MNSRFIIILIALSIVNIQCKTSKHEMSKDSSLDKWTDKIHPYAITSVDIQNVKLTDDFWLPLVKKVQEKTISYAINKCEEEGRLYNFLLAGGKVKGEIKGAMPFDDTDIYKIIEGASNTLISSPDKRLDALLDSLIAIIAVGQEKDGYLTTWRTVNPTKPPAPWVKVIQGKRFESLEASHELYNAGHLYEAAAVHFKATGKRNFLNIALKNADMMIRTFGDEPGKQKGVPGHQIIETGLIQLYKITNNKNYLALSKYFLDNRGNANHHKLYGDYSQDHIPVVSQSEAIGHAVRAVYMYAAMTDIAAMTHDPSYGSAVQKLWENMVTKKMYVTGGIGARHEGEAFGANYELPNLTAYSETCAAIGSIYWNHRLFLMSGDVKYYDIIERTLYNSMIAGISLEGTQFFYPNALESDGIYKFNRGHCTREGWFDCSCCPTNIIRFLPAMSSLIYAYDQKNIYVNMLVGSETQFDVKGGKFFIKQTTGYPWKGGVGFNILNNSKENLSLKIRIPHWLRNRAVPGDLYKYATNVDRPITLYVNGKNQVFENEKGYISVILPANKASELKLDFEMASHTIESNLAVAENIGKLALEYGPMIYAFEEVDQKNTFDKLSLSSNETWTPVFQKDLLGGVIKLESGNKIAIPYFAWSNRGVGKMKVWTSKEEE
jgi:uncharacterized protein